MPLSLAPDLEELIQAKVKAPYSSPEEVIREAMRLLELRDRRRREKFEALKRDLRVAFDQIEQGQVVDGPSAIQAIRRKIRDRS
jgi:Arc/MetJ-type ribon-helix-helix transcriptional regulator